MSLKSICIHRTRVLINFKLVKSTDKKKHLRTLNARHYCHLVKIFPAFTAVVGATEKPLGRVLVGLWRYIERVVGKKRLNTKGFLNLILIRSFITHRERSRLVVIYTIFVNINNGWETNGRCAVRNWFSRLRC